MNPEQYQRLSALFQSHHDSTLEAKRAAIEATLADDPTLLAVARQMLDAETGIADDDNRTPFPFVAPASPTTPREIGGYTIIRELGSGATGTVYEAEQRSPKRRVALKVLNRLDAASRVARRFELEAEILGRLRHPNIAQVYASGVARTDLGEKPYICMELVLGAPLATWARLSSAGVRDRLTRFAEICDAVHYANQRGVIHRDLKPANILIDEDGRPKVLDFGIARALDGAEAAGSLGTVPGEILGTLAYMSPEQARGDTDAVDVRTDVYALGAVLFELLSGRPPVSIEGVSFLEALDEVRSGRRRALSQTGTSVSDDLELIVATAIHTDPERRYASAGALAEDIRRFLNREPILARAPSMSYQMLRFVQRRRQAAATIAIVVTGLSVATAMAVRSAVVAGAARDAEVVAKLDAESAAREAERQQQLATERREEAELLLMLLTDAISSANPNIDGQAEYTVRAFLQDVSDELASDPPDVSDAALGQLRTVIGDALIGLGQARSARRELLEASRLRVAALGEDHPDTIETRTYAAVAAIDMGELDLATQELEAIADRAARALGPGDPRTTTARYYLATTLFKQGDIEGSEPYFRALMEHYIDTRGEQDADALTSMGALALVLQRIGRTDESLDLHRRTIAGTVALYGEEHPYTLTSRTNLALLLMDQDQFDRAKTILTQVLRVRQSELPAGHYHIGVTQSLLARAMNGLGEYEAAAQNATAAFELLEENLGSDHNYTRIARSICEQVYTAWGKPETAAMYTQPADEG